VMSLWLLSLVFVPTALVKWPLLYYFLVSVLIPAPLIARGLVVPATYSTDRATEE